MYSEDFVLHRQVMSLVGSTVGGVALPHRLAARRREFFLQVRGERRDRSVGRIEK
jgi:hypothetical protein